MPARPARASRRRPAAAGPALAGAAEETAAEEEETAAEEETASAAASRWLQLTQSQRASTGSSTAAGICAASGPGSRNSSTPDGREDAQPARAGPESGAARPYPDT